MSQEYRDDYPKRKIPTKGNPYWMCAKCGRSDPEINGEIKNHYSHCEWRIKQENKK